MEGIKSDALNNLSECIVTARVKCFEWVKLAAKCYVG